MVKSALPLQVGQRSLYQVYKYSDGNNEHDVQTKYLLQQISKKNQFQNRYLFLNKPITCTFQSRIFVKELNAANPVCLSEKTYQILKPAFKTDKNLKTPHPFHYTAPFQETNFTCWP